jgi:hypothetical protein
MLRHAATFGSETNAVMSKAGECAFPSASLHGAATMLWRMLELGQQRKENWRKMVDMAGFRQC